MEDALVVCCGGALAGERSDRGADCSALPRSCPAREAAPRRRVELCLCPLRDGGRGGPRTVDATLQRRLRVRDGVEGRRDGAASMEAHRSALCPRAAKGLAAQAALLRNPRVKRPAAAFCGYGCAAEASLLNSRSNFPMRSAASCPALFFVVAAIWPTPGQPGLEPRRPKGSPRISHREGCLAPTGKLLGKALQPALGKTGAPALPRATREAATENTVREHYRGSVAEPTSSPGPQTGQPRYGQGPEG